MSSGLILSTVWQGLLWGILALGVYITYRVLDVADLTVEGSYPLGAAVAISYIAGGGSPRCCDRAAAHKIKNSGFTGRDFDYDWIVFH